MLSYYQILQVDENATIEEIKKAYRKLSKILHPDLHENSKESNVIFNLLHEAYETLSDSSKRQNYNPNLKSENSSNLNVSYEDYKEIVTNYKKILKFKEIREKELLSEIESLKNKINLQENSKGNENSFSEMNISSTSNIYTSNKPISKRKKKKKKEVKDSSSLIISIIIVLILSFIFMFSINYFGYFLILFFLLVLYIINLIYKIFK